MPKETYYSLTQIKKNLTSFYKKITDKNMDENFWIIADRSDFQPLKRIIKSQIKTKSNAFSIIDHKLENQKSIYTPFLTRIGCQEMSWEEINKDLKYPLHQLF